MAESNINIGLIDVERELDQIKALGRAIGALMIDEAQINRSDVGELGYLVSHLTEQVEEKLDEQVKLMKEKWGKEFAEQLDFLRQRTDSQPQPEGLPEEHEG